MEREVEIPRPPTKPALTEEQAEKLAVARHLVDELWLEPEETGLIQKILPWLLLSLNVLILLIVIFLKH
jgi:hypothetical protein